MVEKLNQEEGQTGTESGGRSVRLPQRRRQAQVTSLSQPARNGSPSTVAAESDALDKINALATVFDFRDASTVRAYLLANADLLPLIDQISEKVAVYLPADERLILEIVEDPEDDDARPGLFALVPTRLGSKEARRRLDELSRDWWLGAYRRVGGRLNLDVEYL